MRNLKRILLCMLLMGMMVFNGVSAVSAAAQPTAAEFIRGWIQLLIDGRYEEAMTDSNKISPVFQTRLARAGGIEGFVANMETQTGKWLSVGEFELVSGQEGAGYYWAELICENGVFDIEVTYENGRIVNVVHVFIGPPTPLAPIEAEAAAPAQEPMAAADYAPSAPSPSFNMPGYDNHFRIMPPPAPYIRNREEYLTITENTETAVKDEPLTTFSLKVDTASYRNIARYIEDGQIPPPDAVRIEEMINYFSYDEPLPENDTPFSIYTEIGPSPFDADKEIVFVRVKSKEIDRAELPKSNLTFLIDSSGSMNSDDKLPLLKSSFALLVENLTEEDTVSVVTYAGSAEVVLDSVSGAEKSRILKAIFDLRAGGSTAGADGINTAYALAEKNFAEGGNNRVLLATDGDFNVGVSSVGGLEDLITKKRESGIYLSILGFGTGNLKDDRMETLAKNGNGNYGYIDSIVSAQRTLVDELGATLHTVADDVKAQIEFNPAQVSGYRLIGYENRMMANEDFADDTKDAGEIGAGTDVVLLFEITRAGKEKPGVDIALKYQPKDDAELTPQEEEITVPAEFADELMQVSIRYKEPGEDVSRLITEPVKQSRYLDANTDDFNFAVSVAAWGHLLKDSAYTGEVTVGQVLSIANDSLGEDSGGYREELISLLEGYQEIIERGRYYPYPYPYVD